MSLSASISARADIFSWLIEFLCSVFIGASLWSVYKNTAGPGQIGRAEKYKTGKIPDCLDR